MKENGKLVKNMAKGRGLARTGNDIQGNGNRVSVMGLGDTNGAVQMGTLWHTMKGNGQKTSGMVKVHFIQKVRKLMLGSG